MKTNEFIKLYTVIETEYNKMIKKGMTREDIREEIQKVIEEIERGNQ